MASPYIQLVIEKALIDHGALTFDEFKDIIDYLVGRTKRSISDQQIKQVFDETSQKWQR